MDNKFSVEYTSKMEKALRQIAKEDKKLFAEIVKKIEFFQKGEHEKLTLAPIKRKQAKYKISEIKIKSPESYRIFYVCIDEKNKRVVFLDGQRKKVQAFKDDYFKVLDKALDIYLDEVKGDKNEWFK